MIVKHVNRDFFSLTRELDKVVIARNQSFTQDNDLENLKLTAGDLINYYGTLYYLGALVHEVRDPLNSAMCQQEFYLDLNHVRTNQSR